MLAAPWLSHRGGPARGCGRNPEPDANRPRVRRTPAKVAPRQGASPLVGSDAQRLRPAAVGARASRATDTDGPQRVEKASSKSGRPAALTKAIGWRAPRPPSHSRTRNWLHLPYCQRGTAAAHPLVSSRDQSVFALDVPTCGLNITASPAAARRRCGRCPKRMTRSGDARGAGVAWTTQLFCPQPKRSRIGCALRSAFARAVRECKQVHAGQAPPIPRSCRHCSRARRPTRRTPPASAAS